MKTTTGFVRGLCRLLGLAILVGPILAGCGESGTAPVPEGTTPREEIGDSMSYMRDQVKSQKKSKKAAPRASNPR